MPYFGGSLDVGPFEEKTDYTIYNIGFNQISNGTYVETIICLIQEVK